jgi:hypothetical protein
MEDHVRLSGTKYAQGNKNKNGINVVKTVVKYWGHTPSPLSFLNSNIFLEEGVLPFYSKLLFPLRLVTATWTISGIGAFIMNAPLFLVCLSLVCHIVHGAVDTPAASQDDKEVPPPWGLNLEGRFDALQTSLQKISAEQRLLEREVKHPSNEEAVQDSVRKHLVGLEHSLKRSNRVAKADQARSALTRTWLSGPQSGGVVADNANGSDSGQLQSNAACPSIATGHDTVYLESRAWTWGYTVDVLVPDGKGGKQVVGTVHSTPFAFDRNMTLTNTEGQMVSSSKKYFFTTVRDTYYTIKGT